MKPIKPEDRYIVKQLPYISISIKKKGKVEYRHMYTRFKSDCIELSEKDDFRILMYIPYSEITKMKWDEYEKER